MTASKDRQKVLIIEDNEALASVMMNKLESSGFEAVLAEDGEKGLAMIASETPDLILLDILLPKVNGYEILEQMNESGTIKEIPVVVLSNSGQPVEISRILDLGVIDYFVKADFSPNEVIEKVRAALSKWSEQPKKKRQVADAITILLIEDDELLRTLFVQGVKESGAQDEIIFAKGGEEGLTLMQSQRPSVILLDLIMMGGLDGFQTLTKIRENHEYDDIPVIILSNLGQKEDVSKAKEMGADEFLIKSNYSIPEILSQVRAIVERGRSAQ